MGPVASDVKEGNRDCQRGMNVIIIVSGGRRARRGEVVECSLVTKRERERQVMLVLECEGELVAGDLLLEKDNTRKVGDWET